MPKNVKKYFEKFDTVPLKWACTTAMIGFKEN